MYNKYQPKHRQNRTPSRQRTPCHWRQVSSAPTTLGHFLSVGLCWLRQSAAVAANLLTSFRLTWLTNNNPPLPPPPPKRVVPIEFAVTSRAKLTRRRILFYLRFISFLPQLCSPTAWVKNSPSSREKWCVPPLHSTPTGLLRRLMKGWSCQLGCGNWTSSSSSACVYSAMPEAWVV